MEQLECELGGEYNLEPSASFSLEPTVVSAEQSCPAWAQLSLSADAYDIGRQQGLSALQGDMRRVCCPLWA